MSMARSATDLLSTQLVAQNKRRYFVTPELFNNLDA